MYVCSSCFLQGDQKVLPSKILKFCKMLIAAPPGVGFFAYRLTRIQSSDHILKHAFAGIFVYVVYLCFVYCGWLVEAHNIFQVCPQKQVRRSQIWTSRWPRALRYDPIFKKFSQDIHRFFSHMSSSSILLKPGVSFILFKKCDKILYNAGVNIAVNRFIKENQPNNSTLRNCAPNSNFDWVQGSFFKDGGYSLTRYDN